jgi:hypothetical protein
MFLKSAVRTSLLRLSDLNEGRLSGLFGAPMNLAASYLKKQTTLRAVLRRFNFETCSPEFKADWDRLTAKRKCGDQLWVFGPPRGAIEIWGIALVRKGRAISTLVEAVG